MENNFTGNGFRENLLKQIKEYLDGKITKEEYYSTVLMNKGINSNSLAEITAAFLGVSKKKKKDKDAQVISKLEEIIAELRMDNEKDM